MARLVVLGLEALEEEILRLQDVLGLRKGGGHEGVADALLELLEPARLGAGVRAALRARLLGDGLGVAVGFASERGRLLVRAKAATGGGGGALVLDGARDQVGGHAAGLVERQPAVAVGVVLFEQPVELLPLDRHAGALEGLAELSGLQEAVARHHVQAVKDVAPQHHATALAEPLPRRARGCLRDPTWREGLGLECAHELTKLVKVELAILVQVRPFDQHLEGGLGGNAHAESREQHECFAPVDETVVAIVALSKDREGTLREALDPCTLETRQGICADAAQTRRHAFATGCRAPGCVELACRWWG